LVSSAWLEADFTALPNKLLEVFGRL